MRSPVTYLLVLVGLWVSSELASASKLESFIEPESSKDLGDEARLAGAVRQPRFLLRTTTTVTSTTTLSTNTACYTSNAAFTAVCAKRRKRRMLAAQEAIDSMPKELGERLWKQLEAEALVISPSKPVDGAAKASQIADEEKEVRFKSIAASS